MKFSITQHSYNKVRTNRVLGFEKNVILRLQGFSITQLREILILHEVPTIPFLSGTRRLATNKNLFLTGKLLAESFKNTWVFERFRNRLKILDYLRDLTEKYRINDNTQTVSAFISSCFIFFSDRICHHFHNTERNKMSIGSRCLGAWLIASPTRFLFQLKIALIAHFNLSHQYFALAYIPDDYTLRYWRSR